MAVRILAADDSATMRKVIEMTFAGEGVEVTTVASGEAAVQAATASPPDLVIADASMAMSGYDVAHALKSNASTASVAVIVLASQHTPFDSSKAKDCGVDDHILKPYDSQAMIDKAMQVLVQAARGRERAHRPAESRPRSPSPPAPPETAAVARSRGRPAVHGASGARLAALRPSRSDRRRSTGPGEDQGRRPPVRRAPEAPSAAVAAAKPMAKPHRAQARRDADARSVPRPRPASAGDSPRRSSGDMAPKLAELGLDEGRRSRACSRCRSDVIERVVWEVVPDLAEVLIKEEIRRLTSD